ncbi:MAG: Hsp20 family protein [Alphaproteobacteria bacterium]|nr:Hsp20 family protein [Alphaproteobacteria bacterium]MDX5369640.1 Hsp20 family protein [Alphaproteobacteria bacterium]MDX5464275.1 Hsp20 family protein [Alphaproteobacteria bacterium]
MRTFDLSPLYRSTVGFDRLFNLLDPALSGDRGDGYPPYNIEKTGDDAYRITLAVAGFTQDELAIEAKDTTLTVTAQKSESQEQETASYLYRGIAARGFQRRFALADHVKVKGATLENGLLHIDLQREVPEELKPRRIEIATSTGTKAIEQAA